MYHGTGRMLGPSIFSPAPGTISVDLAGGENVMLIGSNVMLLQGHHRVHYLIRHLMKKNDFKLRPRLNVRRTSGIHAYCRWGRNWH